ncbi:MAG: acetyl-CoA carboxylase biotin carboxylase subunit family protein [Saprospiraceae bacterium]
MTILCVSSYFKGSKFMTAAKAEGATVYLLTSISLKDEPWPKEAIDEMFYVQEANDEPWNMTNVIKGLAHTFRSKKVDRIVALDDFDVERAAQLREEFRIPGMGQTTARYFRDKLAMRVKAADSGIKVPAFSALFNDAEVHEYTQNVPAPWLVKPRSEASATGIKKIHSADELWQHLGTLGDRRHEYLVEKFEPGDVYHVDSLSQDGELIFSRVSQYLNTPFEVAHGGGIFRSHICEFGGEDDKALRTMTNDVMTAFGMVFSASHTEFIKSHSTGEFYFLETSSRVGGAHLAEMVEYSSGISLWAEWAKLEIAQFEDKKYTLPTIKNDYAGIVVSLIRDYRADYSSFNDSEICWTMEKDYHIGIIINSDSRQRILGLLDNYAKRIFEGSHASAPSK